MRHRERRGGQNSIAKSRSETASSEFSHTPSKPSSLATDSRSIGIARAGERRGAERQAVHAPAAVGEALGVAREHLEVGEQVVAEGHRLRDLQVREARHHGVGVRLGKVEQRARAALRMSAASASIAARRYSRMSVATWSLRERAVCRRLPASPTSSVRRRSMLRCTSSRSIDQAKRARADLVADLRQAALDRREVGRRR